MSVRVTALILILSALLLVSCGPKPAGETGTEIISAEEALAMVDGDNVVLVDARGTLDYRKGFVPGAVSISRADIVINTPVNNMLAPQQQIEAVMSSRGISNDTMVVIYDDNKNMDSARLWWTLKVYGHDAVKVVSGGLSALQAEGAELTTAVVAPTPAQFTATAPDSTMIATQSDLRKQVNTPDPRVVVIDTRTEEEYAEGTIPGSVCIDFAGNNYADGTFKPVQQIRIRYIESGLDYDSGAIMYCKTSIRGAQTFLALYNAGYRNLKLYDGAWLEWSSNPMNPVFVPEPDVIQLEASDNS